MSQETKKPSSCVMSLKKLNQVKDVLIRYYGENNVENVIDEICQTINFDPNYSKGRYTPEIGKRFVEWQQRRVDELGITQSQYRKGFLKST